MEHENCLLCFVVHAFIIFFAISVVKCFSNLIYLLEAYVDHFVISDILILRLTYNIVSMFAI